MSDVGEMIRTMRRSRGMSQADLADSLGVSRSTIAMYETGQHEPDLDTLDALADVFNVDIATILGHGDENDEVAEIREMMRRSSDVRTLFRLTRNSTSKEIRQYIAIIKSLKGVDTDDA